MDYVDIQAKMLYRAYCRGVGGVSWDGKPLPDADEFFADESKSKQADGWREVSKWVDNLPL